MRKNKGYQKDKRSWRKHNSGASGHTETLDQYLDRINRCFDKRVETCKKEYSVIATKTTLDGEDLYKYCRDQLMWEIRFDIDWNKNRYNLIPLADALKMLEEDRRKTIGKRLYSRWGSYQKRIIHKDNQKFVYNSSGGNGHTDSIRVPSVKRSRSTWKRFYELFPEAKGLKTFRGFKLRKLD